MSEQTHGSEHEPSLTSEAVEEDGLHVDRWEGIWIRTSIIISAVFILAILVAALSFGIQVPGAYARINPNTLSDAGNPFAQPGLRELAPGQYEAYIVAQTWNFLPDRMEVPAGSQITFYITSRDVQHGLKLVGTNINLMVLPGQVSTLTATFNRPGTYDYICHEYCGYVAGAPIGHHTMYGQLTVLPPATVTETVQTVTN